MDEVEKNTLMGFCIAIKGIKYVKIYVDPTINLLYT